MRSYYVHPVDVLRRFDPTLTQTDLEDEALFGADDAEKVWARIDEVESDFESRTRPARLVRVGVPDRLETYETHAERSRDASGIRISLDNREVLPFDSDAGDRLELRTGKNSWRDITDRHGSRWELDPAGGWIRIYQRYVRRNLWREAVSDRIVRCTYRHSGLGGTPDRAGETELEADVDDSETEWSVAEPHRLPQRGILYVGADEYVHLESIDYDTGTLTIRRGRRGTTPSAHDAGTTVHYCPLDIRGAIAGQVAAELVRTDDIADNLGTPADDLSRSDRIEAWEEEYDDLLASRAEVHPL